MAVVEKLNEMYVVDKCFLVPCENLEYDKLKSYWETPLGNFMSYYNHCLCILLLKQEVGLGHKPIETRR